MNTIAIATHDTNLLLKAKVLAEKLHLPLVALPNDDYRFIILVTKDYVGLLDTLHFPTQAWFIDFSNPQLSYRKSHASLKKEALAKAIGRAPHQLNFVLDVTAGLGRDSFILASLGYSIVLLERSAIIYTLLLDALNRAASCPKLSDIVAKMTLIHSDSIAYLKTHSQKAPEIIYMDPMFPPRKKSAAVKKEMFILQELAPYEAAYETENLFEQALACASLRVVVKRPNSAGYLLARKPHYSITGKSCRFDIYFPKVNCD